MSEESKVHIYELEQGPILGEYDESDEEEGPPNEFLTEWVESVELEHREINMKETEECYDFETKNLCVNAGFESQEDEHTIEVVRKEVT